MAWHQQEQLDEFASRFGIEGVGDYETVLERDDVDIVHLAAPVAELPDLTVRAARRGKHMVLGKPMAMTVPQADAMVAAVRDAGVTCVAFQGLMRLQAAALKARLDRGEIGDIVVMHQASRWSIAEDWPPPAGPGWFVDPGQVPGGALIDEGIYWIDLFRWLAAQRDRPGGSQDPANLVHTDIAVEDWGFATFTFANGDHRHARRRVDDQCATKDRAVAETERRRAARDRGTRGEIRRPAVPGTGASHSCRGR